MSMDVDNAVCTHRRVYSKRRKGRTIFHLLIGIADIGLFAQPVSVMLQRFIDTYH